MGVMDGDLCQIVLRDGMSWHLRMYMYDADESAMSKVECMVER